MPGPAPKPTPVSGVIGGEPGFCAFERAISALIAAICAPNRPKIGLVDGGVGVPAKPFAV